MFRTLFVIYLLLPTFMLLVEVRRQLLFDGVVVSFRYTLDDTIFVERGLDGSGHQRFA
jgi:hypothetical protein